MRQTHLPHNAFIDPHGQNADAIRDLLKRVTAILLDFTAQAADSPPLPGGPR